MTSATQLELPVPVPDEFGTSDRGYPYFYWDRPDARFPHVSQVISIHVEPYYGADLKAMKARTPREFIVDGYADTRQDFTRFVQRCPSLEAATAKARELLPYLRNWFAVVEHNAPTCACCGDGLRAEIRVICLDCGHGKHEGPATCKKRLRLEREAREFERRRAEYLAGKADGT